MSSSFSFHLVCLPLPLSYLAYKSNQIKSNHRSNCRTAIMEIKPGLSALVTGGASGIGNNVFSYLLRFTSTIPYSLTFLNCALIGIYLNIGIAWLWIMKTSLSWGSDLAVEILKNLIFQYVNQSQVHQMFILLSSYVRIKLTVRVMQYNYL